MGVNDLNTIIKKYGIPQSSRHYLAAIIDGNNLMFIRIQSTLETIYKLYNIATFNGINMSLIEQMQHLITNTVRDCGSVLKRIINNDNCDAIYIVFDPPGTPNYRISREMKYTDNLLLKDTDICDLLLADNDEVLFNMKADEQDKRKKAMEKTLNQEKLIKSISNLTNDENMKQILINIFHQSSFFKANPLYTTRLMRLVIVELYKYVHQEGFIKDPSIIHFIQANDEADLAIRNLGEFLLTQASTNKSKTRDLLILSSDTDYYILFANCPTAYCRTLLMSNHDTYRPMQIFQALLKEHYSYDIVIRLSPMLGNDYTVHQPIAAARNIQHLLYLFSIGGDLRNLSRTSGITTVKKLYNANINLDYIQAAITNNDITKTNLLFVDNLIKNFNQSLYNRYIMSVLIYKNIEYYNRYSEFHINEQDTIATYNTFQKFLLKFFNIFYVWEYEGIFNKQFIDSIKEIKFDINNDNELYSIISENKKIVEKDTFEDMPTLIETSDNEEENVDDMLENIAD